MPIIKKTFQYGDHQVVIETGRIARQANGAVLVNMADTAVLVSVVGRKEANPDQSFFPLTVNYQERTYSAGKIPGGFFKREGRPSEKEVLISRLIDRPLRPSFPSGFMNEVQVIATVMSLNPEVDSDIPAMLGASAALEISGLPFNGPIGGAKVAYIDQQYVLNPTASQLSESELNLIIAGNESSILMVESQASSLSEAQMLGAVGYGHEQMQTAIKAIKEFGEEVGTPRWDWQDTESDAGLESRINDHFASDIEESYKIFEKHKRKQSLEDLFQRVTQEFVSDECGEGKVKSAFKAVEKKIVRARVLSGEPRIDGRDTRTVRPLRIEVGVLPRTHGSALFTRGETQALVVTTLGMGRDAQIIDALDGETRDRFMLHYNFPPYCVGETGFMGSPKRREIGHGKLTKRALAAVMPDKEEFPYVIRVVSEITESNGSSSMASTCGTTLSLLDAGVPIKAPVAGIAMGLVIEDDKFAVLTDILGDEDHLGDMDFKVAGTTDGVTALQMDIKTNGVTLEIMSIVLEQAKEGRLHILAEMQAVIDKPNELSVHSPRLITMTINPDRIRDVIGKGGSTIRSITEETGATIDIEDSGIICIASVDKEAADRAKARIEELTAEVEVGKIYEGKVSKIVDFGAFVTILPGLDGLVHISQIVSGRRVEKVSDELSEGASVKVKVLEVDKQGRVRLSMKDDVEDSGIANISSGDREAADRAKAHAEELAAEVEVGKIYEGKVSKIVDFGAFVTILPGLDGLVHISQIVSGRRVEKVSDELSEGASVKVKVLEVDKQGRVRLSMKEVA